MVTLNTMTMYSKNYINQLYISRAKHKDIVMSTAKDSYIIGYVKAMQDNGFLLFDVDTKDLREDFILKIHRYARQHASKMVK